MKKTARKIAAASLAIALLSVQTSSTFAGGWMDDWLQSKTSSSPDSFEGQARGYATGGSFSARWSSHNDYPVSVQAPRISVGCGGIDFYGGSLSFLKPEMMVKKLQGILQNSAFVAFDMALDTLCPKCSVLMKAAEDISNKLNSMAVDDCKAAKGMVATLQPAADAVKGYLYEGKSADSINEGLSESWSNMKNSVPSLPTSSQVSNWWEGMKGTQPNHNSSVSGCTGILADIFPSNKDLYPLSIMEVIGNNMGLPQDHVAMMRGLVGDIIVMNGNDHETRYSKPCAENSTLNLEKIKNGDVYAMDKNGVCTMAVSNQGNLVNYVSTMMNNISAKLKSGNTPLDQTTEIPFIKSVPVAVLYGMRVAIGSGQESMLISSLADITATAWTYRSIQDLMARSYAILRVSSKTNSSIVNGSDDCNIGIAASPLAESQKEMFENFSKVVSLLNSQMASQLKEFDSTITLAKHLEEINNQIKGYVARNFSPSVADRAMRHI